MNIKTLILLLHILTLSSCSDITTSNPEEVYKYWSETELTTDLGLLNGQYWQSSHLTKEYIMYLEFKPSDKWWDDFLEQNHISIDKGDFIIPSDSPAWFKPSENSIKYRTESNFDQGSRYFKDISTGICYIYEIQL